MVTESDLFGLDRALTPAERKKMNRRTPVPRGHAWKPGTGPTGETCGTCRHLYRNRMAKTYLKCALMQVQWTGGAGTDVRAKDAACKFWGSNNERD